MAASKPVSAAYRKRLDSYVKRYFPEYQGARLPSEIRSAANGNPPINPKTQAGAKALALAAASNPEKWGEALRANERASEALARLAFEQPNILDTALASAVRYKRHGQVDVDQNFSGLGPISFSIGINEGRSRMDGPASTPRPVTSSELRGVMEYYADVPVRVYFSQVYEDWEVYVAINSE
jgi:hypothetical protein